MSTTTQILFNSPALHSLKRDQLVKLCKIHSIKASGKNVELINKLKLHAQTLPRDAPLSIAARSEDGVPCLPLGDEVAGDDEPNHPRDKDQDDKEQDEEENINNTEEGNDDNANGSSSWRFQMPRPSEQWEVVMDSIEELEESSSQGTLSSLRTLGGNGNATAGEFGTGGSKSSSVGLSIRALATSLGLKRSTSSKSAFSMLSTSTSASSIPSSTQPQPDELTAHAVPYASLPDPDPSTLPQTDHFTFTPGPVFPSSSYGSGVTFAGDPTPLPGHTLRPGIPAPSGPNARLSLGLSTPKKDAPPSTTIRLITSSNNNGNNNNQYSNSFGFGAGPATPQLKAFETTFDLVLGSPTGFGTWPRTQGEGGGGMYPALPVEDNEKGQAVDPDGDMDVDMPGALTFAPPKVSTTNAPSTPVRPNTATSNDTLAPQPAPFIFGSPLPQHNLTNTQFRTAAASVLEEMNRRLEMEGVEGVGAEVLERVQLGKGRRAVLPLPGSAGAGGREKEREREREKVREKFEKAHEEAFGKMESIAVRGGSPVKEQDSAAGVGGGKKRKSSVLSEGRDARRRPSGVGRAGRGVSGTRVISNGRRRGVPGGFGDEDEESDGEDERRMSKRVRVEGNGGAADNEQEKEENKEDVGEAERREKEKEKEREAIRRKLEMNKARRRSSMGVNGGGRVSIGRAPILKPKPKPSRFGFLSSAKSMVQNVWNRGAKAPPASAAAPATASGIPVSKPTIVAPTTTTTTAASSNHRKGSTRSSTSIAKPTSQIPSTSSRLLKPAQEKDRGTISSTTSSGRSRSPIPSFTGAGASGSVAGSTNSRAGSLAGTTNAAGTAKSRFGSRNSSVTGPASRVSSIGTRTSNISNSNSHGNASSIGTRSGFGSGSNSRVSSLGTRGSLASMGSSGDVGSTGSKKQSFGPQRKMSGLSRLLAPTASSLAKAHANAGIRPSSSLGVVGSGLAAVAEDRSASTSALDQITNTNAKNTSAGSNISIVNSPARPGIFSKHLMSPSSIPTPVKPAGSATSIFTSGTAAAAGSSGMKPPVPSAPKPRMLAGRKPRISRSKVIAKLASQRAASGGAGTGAGAGSVAAGGGRTRSSLGAKVQRQSFGGGLKAGGRSADVMNSARKRARQSEYARRRSRVGGGSAVGVGGGGKMDVDDDDDDD